MSSEEEEEVGGGSTSQKPIYIHWKDEYWDSKEGEPHPPPNTTLPSARANLSDSQRLEAASQEVFTSLLPLMVALALVLLLTLCGHALVILVYRTRFKRNSASLLVVVVSCVEAVLAGLCVPLELALLVMPLASPHPLLCQLLRYLQTAALLSLMLLLTAVAADRYCKLHRPTNFLPLRWTKGLCVGAPLVGLALALPAFLVFGTRSVALREGVVGSVCGVDDGARSSPFRLVYVTLLMLTFTLMLGAMAVLYALIFVRICRRKSAGARGEKVSPARREYPRKHRFVTEDSTSSCGGLEETRKLPTSGSHSNVLAAGAAPRSGRTSPALDQARVPLKSGVTKESARIGQHGSSAVDVHSTQMTRIFFLLSLLVVLLLTPFLVLRCLRVLSDVMDRPHLLLLNRILDCSYLLHAPLVPLLYLLNNHNFRRETRLLLQKLGLSCKRRPPSPQPGNR